MKTIELNTQQTMTSLEIAELTGKQHKHVMEAIRKMEPAWVKTCGSNFRLTSRTIVQPNGGTREVPCYQLTKTECLYIAMSQRAWHRVMGRSSPFASLYSTSAKLRPLTFSHAGSMFRMASIMSQRAWHRVMFSPL